MDKKYNGYKNWETWNVALWLNNTEAYYNAVKGTDHNYIEKFVTDQFAAEQWGDLAHPQFGDIDNYDDFDKVNWQEVARAIND